MKLNAFTFAATPLLLIAASLSAQSAHTWVSATGNDTTGTGTPAKPYATFQVAANNTSAGGIISVLGPGDYGPLTISQSLTIDGTGGGSIGFNGSEGIYISPVSTTVAANVYLRNLVINGLGVGDDGIFASGLLNLTIDGCVISNYADLGFGLGSSAAENIVIKNTTITGGNLGVRVFQGTGPDVVSLDHVTVQGVVQGTNPAAVFTRSGKMEISNANITQSAIGIEADTDATINMANSVLSANTYAICVYSGSTANLSNTSLFDNTTTIEACGGVVSGSASNQGPAPKVSNTIRPM